jgi:hypothetical protein
MFDDLKDARLIYLKGFLFLLAGCVAAGGIILESGSLRIAFLLAVAIWAFARFYYFAFYVIQHYVDPAYKFAGLSSFALYLLRRQNAGQGGPTPLGGTTPIPPASDQKIPSRPRGR